MNEQPAPADCSLSTPMLRLLARTKGDDLRDLLSDLAANPFDVLVLAHDDPHNAPRIEGTTALAPYRKPEDKNYVGIISRLYQQTRALATSRTEGSDFIEETFRSGGRAYHTTDKLTSIYVFPISKDAPSIQTAMAALQDKAQQVIELNEQIRVLQQQKQELDLINQELARQNAALNETNMTDALTGVWNRRALDLQSEIMFASMQRDGIERTSDKGTANSQGTEYMFVMTFDIDRFKDVNDTHGHDIGDAVIRHVATNASNALKRPTDALFRFGGDEFVAIGRTKNTRGIGIVAENIRQSIIAARDENLPPVTISVGAAYLAFNQDTAKINLGHLMKASDNALYTAKDGGRNQSVVHELTPSMAKQIDQERVTVRRPAKTADKGTDACECICPREDVGTPGHGKKAPGLDITG